MVERTPIKRWAWLGLAALLVALGVLTAFNKPAFEEVPASGTAMPAIDSCHIIGIDVSHHQGTIKWQEVSHWNDVPIRFVYIKATEGATFKDPRYSHNIQKAREQGFKVGSYHFFRCGSTADAQFANIKNSVKKDQQDMRVIVDIEVIKRQNIKRYKPQFKRLLKLLEQHYGHKPIIYTYERFFNTHFGPEFKEYPLIIAKYQPFLPELNHGHNWTAWQFSQTGKVKGINGHVDINVLHEEAELEHLLASAHH
jgi:lysozyme